MSLNCKVQISINNISEEKAKAVQKALEPDNINFPKDLSLKVEKIDNNQEATGLSSELINDLRALKELYDEGVLTKEEFTKAKEKLLN